MGISQNKLELKQSVGSNFVFMPLSQTGFTLIELLVTISIAAILVGIAVPSFKETIKSNRLSTYASEFITALNLARSEAVKRGVPVTVRKVDNKSKTKVAADAEWEDGWDIFTDSDGVIGEFDGADVLIKSHTAFNATYTFRGKGAVANFIRFSSFGQKVNSENLVLCDNSDNNATPEANTSKLININPTGRARIMPDTNTNKDGVPNKLNGDNILSCLPPF